MFDVDFVPGRLCILSAMGILHCSSFPVACDDRIMRVNFYYLAGFLPLKHPRGSEPVTCTLSVLSLEFFSDVLRQSLV